MRRLSAITIGIALLVLTTSACQAQPVAEPIQTKAYTIEPTASDTATVVVTSSNADTVLLQTPTPLPLAPQVTSTPQPFLLDGGALPEGALLRIGIGYILTHAISPDRSQVAIGTSTGIYVYAVDGFKRIWRRYTDFPVGDIQWSPDGTRLVSGTDSSYNDFAEPILWEADTGKKLSVLEGGWYGGSWSPDGNLIAVVQFPDFDGTSIVTLYDGHTGLAVRHISLSNELFLNRVVWSSDGTKIAVADTRRIWSSPAEIPIIDVSTGAIVSKLAAYLELSDLAFNPNSEHLAVAGFGSRSYSPLWDSQSGTAVAEIPVDDYGDGIAWSPDGRFLVLSKYKLQNAIVVDIALNQTIATIPVPARMFAWSLDQSKVAASSHEGVVYVYDISSRSIVSQLALAEYDPGFGFEMPKATWLSDNRSLLVTTSNNAVIWDSVQHSIISGFSTNIGASKIGWLPGDILAVSGQSGTQYWSFPSGQQVSETIPENELLNLFEKVQVPESPSGNFKVDISAFGGCGDGPIGGGCIVESGKILLTNPTTGKIIFERDYDMTGPASYAWSPDGSLLAVGFGTNARGGGVRGSIGCEVVVLDPISGTHLFTFSAHTGNVEHVAFSPTGRYLASASSDGTVIVWNIGP